VPHDIIGTSSRQSLCCTEALASCQRHARVSYARARGTTPGPRSLGFGDGNKPDEPEAQRRCYRGSGNDHRPSPRKQLKRNGVVFVRLLLGASSRIYERRRSRVSGSRKPLKRHEQPRVRRHSARKRKNEKPQRGQWLASTGGKQTQELWRGS
jgi:hypothetical protein